MPPYWLQNPSALPRPEPGKPRPRLIRSPLFDLPAIQASIRDGMLTDAEIKLATDDSKTDLNRLGWTNRDLLQFLSQLEPYRKLDQRGDFHQCEWCKAKHAWYPCDVYRMHYDLTRKQRSARGASIYVKFSIAETGKCVLHIISAHD
jgi:hypothetical protein